MQRQDIGKTEIVSAAVLSLFLILPVAKAQTRGATDESTASALAEFRAAAKLPPDHLHGAELFRTCAACHGTDGRGTSDGSIPAIAGQHGSVILKQLVDFRHDRRWDERMQHFTDSHHLQTSQDVTDVAAYISSLPRFPATAEGIGDGTALAEGASVYFQVCEACHGPLGQGDVLRLRPRLAGQHYQYLLKQLVETAGGGRPGMDLAHVDRLRKLTPSQIRGIADYLSRMSPDLSSHPTRATQ
jgi:cytochrome c553